MSQRTDRGLPDGWTAFLHRAVRGAGSARIGFHFRDDADTPETRNRLTKDMVPPQVWIPRRKIRFQVLPQVLPVNRFGDHLRNQSYDISLSLVTGASVI